ncbi:hypothetical protein B0H13DRAFT_2381725 [Mycena leptocephala]|nr:hypothetical protein B0H13DRAFT_2381725 [Mycena leptocephala]
MSSSATFSDLPLWSSTFCADLEKSLLFLDWVLASGIKSSGSVAYGVLSLLCEGSTCVMNVNLSIKDSLPFDLVLGCDWYLYCPDSLPGVRFLLTSGILDFAPNSPATVPPIQGCLMDIDTDLDAGFPQHMCFPLLALLTLFFACSSHLYTKTFYHLSISSAIP